MVPDPTELFLARVPLTRVQEADAWQFFAGEHDGEPEWTSDIEDNRTVWVQSNVCPCAPAGMSSYWFGLRPMRLAPVA